MRIISTIQYKPRLATCNADVQDNIRKCTPLFNTAITMGSTIIVLPELAFTGYSFLSFDEALAVAEDLTGPTYQKIAQLAISSESYVSYGFVERVGQKLYNSVNLVSPNGLSVCSYRKVNLWGNDFLWASPGLDAPQIVETPYGKLCPLICRDIRASFPKNIGRVASDFFKAGNPDVVLLSSNWGLGGFPPVAWMNFVKDHGSTLAVANRYGVETNRSFSNDFGQGGSIIIEPNWTTNTNGLIFNADCVVTSAV